MFSRSLLQPHFRLTSRFLTPNYPLQTTLMSSKSNPSPQEQPTPESHSHPEKALPAPSENDGVTTLDVSGGAATVRLDALGPMVMNQDGTVSRISNWTKMSEIERTNTLRIIGQRNQSRLAALRKAQESSGGSENGGRGN